MSSNSIVAFATRFAPKKQREVKMPDDIETIDMEPIDQEEDLEVLARMIEEATRRKVADEAEALRAAERAKQSLEFRNDLVAKFEAVERKRGIKCRS